MYKTIKNWIYRKKLEKEIDKLLNEEIARKLALEKKIITFYIKRFEKARDLLNKEFIDLEEITFQY